MSVRRFGSVVVSRSGQQAYGAKMLEDGLDIESMQHSSKEFALTGDYRKIMAKWAALLVVFDCARTALTPSCLVV